MAPELKGISVVIPCYMKPEQVERCLKYLLKSEGIGKQFSLEILIVDDSPDISVKDVIKSLSDIAPESVTFNYKKPRRNVGIAEARNIGVFESSNDLIVALDTDILVEDGTLLEFLETFNKTKTASMIMGNIYWRGGGDDGKLDRPRKHDRRIRIGGVEYIEMMHGRCIAFRKKAFEEAGGYDSELFSMQGEGPDLSIRFWRSGNPIVYNPKIRMYHLSGFTSKDRSDTPYLYHGWDPSRTELMYRSILLYLYKYGVPEAEKSNWMKTVSLESKVNFGESSEFVILSSISKTLDWIADNHNKISKSRKNMPDKYDFKPYDVFTDKNLLKKCIRSAGK